MNGIACHYTHWTQDHNLQDIIFLSVYENAQKKMEKLDKTACEIFYKDLLQSYLAPNVLK